jgi:acyl-CoA thioesterase YciA
MSHCPRRIPPIGTHPTATAASTGIFSWRPHTFFRAPRAAPRVEDGFELITRRLCLIKDTGHAGVLWGGNMMAWVDEAGAIYAGRQVRNRYMVTKAFTEIDFQSRVVPGDMVTFYGRVARWGRTSLSIDLYVTATHPSEDDEREVLRVTGVFVAIDDGGHKEPLVRAQGRADR